MVALALLLAVVGAGFVLPWLSTSPVRGSDLDRYSPTRDGSSYLTLERGPDGTAEVWRSENVRRVPGLKASTEWRSGAAGALDSFVSRGATIDPSERSRRLERVHAVQISVRELGEDGLRASELYTVVDRAGQWLLAFHDTATGSDSVLEPPLLVRPRDLPVGAVWDSDGAFGGGGASYLHQGEVLERTAHTTPLGRYADCILVEERLQIVVEGETASDTTSRAWSCAGIGAVVEAIDYDPSGRVTASRALVSSDAAGGAVAEDLPDLASVPSLECGLSGAVPCPAEPTTGPDTWSFQRIGSARQSFAGDDATVPPLWIPTDPPLVLTAAAGGDLVAFDPTSGEVAWRFHPAGTIQGAPVYSDGRILFGATDKRVYALDARGMFLWAHRTADSVPTRPLVVGGTVVVGSEDRDVHGLDLVTGAPRWRAATGGPIGSSPAEAAGTIAVGSDDGAVRLLEPSNGRVLATSDLGSAIVAPVVAIPDQPLVLAATTDGIVAAVEVPSGRIRWEASAGAAVREAPAVHNDRVHVADADGVLTILDVVDGSVVATAAGSGYTGAPLATAHGVIAATIGGTMDLLGPDGEVVATWDAADARGVSDGEPTFAIGPTAGGGAVWTVDRLGVLRRLGPAGPDAGPVAVRPAWIRTLTEEPFLSNGSTPVTTAVAWNDRALGIDGGGTVMLTDPATGETDVLGTIDEYSPYVDPVVVGDRLLVAGHRSLRALTLSDLTLEWEVEGAGATARPPVVSGTTVLYASGAMSEGEGATLAAIDLATGEEIWSAPFGPVPLAGGVVVESGTVIGGSPVTAYDLATGEVVWRAEDRGDATLGGPATHAGMVLTAHLAVDGSDRSTLRALDVSSGETRWQVDLGERAMDLTETLHVADGVVVVPTLDGGVLGHSLVDGAEVWRHQPTPPVLGNVAVTDGKVWMVLENGHLQMLDATSGAVVGRATELDFALESQGRTQRPVEVGGHVLVSLGYFLIAFETP